MHTAENNVRLILTGGCMFCQFQGIAGHIGKLVHRFLLVMMGQDQEPLAQFGFTLPDPFKQKILVSFIKFFPYVNLL